MTLLQDLMADVRYALRALRRRPGFAAAVLVTLALGIGANTAVFSVVRAVLLKPLPYEHARELVRIGESGLREFHFGQTSMPNFLDWRENDVFTDMAAYFGNPKILTGEGFPERLTVQWITPSFFAMAGVEPFLGRSFLPHEARNDARVVVLHHGFWQRVFGGDPDVLGRRIVLDDEPYTIVGVMGADVGTSRLPPFNAEMLKPMAAAPTELWRRRVRFLHVLARKKPGVTLERARAEMDALGRRLAADHPEANEGRRVVVAPMLDALVGDVRTPLLLVSGAVALVLGIACVNVANLLLVRATARRSEIAVRAAVGAGTGRLIRQALAESLVLGLLGGGGGLVVAVALQRLLIFLGPPGIPRLGETKLDGAVLLLCFALSLVAAALAGLVPALRTAITLPREGAWRHAPASAKPGGLRLLVAGEVALALVLVIVGSLFVSSFLKLMDVDPGYDTAGVLTLRVSLPRSQYPEGDDRTRFCTRLLERAESLPGVRSASVSSLATLAGGQFGVDLKADDSRESLRGTLWPVTPGYFRTLEVDVVTGRPFSRGDGIDALPVAIVSESTARALFGGRPALGERVTFASHLKTDEGPREIVGVVEDVRPFGLDQEVPLQIYIPYAQWPTFGLHLALRVEGDPSAVLPAVRREVAALDGALPLSRVETLEETLSRTVSQPRFFTVALAAFAAVALFLAGVGVYGVLSYAVSRRSREMAVRLALGARPADLLRLVLGHGMVAATAGIAAGVAVALGVGRWLESELFEMSAADPKVVVLGSLTVALVAGVACLLPARRAATADPVVTLKAE